MKKIVAACLLTVAVLSLTVVRESEAWGGGRVFVGVGVGPVWWGQPRPWWHYPPYPYYPPYVYSPPPTVVVQPPPVYVQQTPPPPAPAPPAEASSSAPAQDSGYWYYCPSVQSYYPDVQTCSEAWIKVPPRRE